MLVREALKSESSYPVPDNQLEVIALKRGVNLEATADASVLGSDSYKLAKADMMRWISTAPNIAEGGVAINILYSDRKSMREMANAIYKELNDPAYVSDKPTYGYKGEDL